MFNSEREMQNLFVSFLKKKKTCGLIFEEVGNRNFFFRTDVVEYKNRNEIIGYELKLKDFNTLINQSLYSLYFYDKSYVVIPENLKNKFIEVFNKLKHRDKDKIGIIIMNKNKYRIVKSANKESNRRYEEKLYCTLISDLIIRGYHKEGMNKCKSYK